EIVCAESYGSMSLRVDVIVSKAVQMVENLSLNLRGYRVLTEAATGYYAVTPVLAALAGAEVLALARDSRYGSGTQAGFEVDRLARAAGLSNRIRVTDRITDQDIAGADLVTNCGHLRPLDRGFVEKMGVASVIALMYEAWEFRARDVDLLACRERGVRVVGTNERHSRLRVFDYLGMLAVIGL